MTAKQIEKAIDKALAPVIEEVKEAAVEAAGAKKQRKRPEPMPAESHYTFKAGQQVALISRKGVRVHYEYVERADRFDIVRDMKTGAEHRVWLNKVAPMGVAEKLLKKQQKEDKAS